MIKETALTNKNAGLKKADFKLLTKIKKDFKLNHSLYIMALPVIIYFIVFKYIPIYGLLMAFCDFSPRLGVFGSEFVGVKHFISFFNSASFFEVLGNTFRISITTIIFGFPMPVILALLLNELKNDKFEKLIQNFTYLPLFISMIVVCGLIKVFTADDGIIGSVFLKASGLSGSMLNYPQFFTSIYVASGIWQEAGWDSIIYLAALTGINQTLYEAAKIDGANRWRQTIHITIPGIMPTIVIMLILKMGGMLNVGFEKILLIYNDATMTVSDVISTYVYRRGLINLDWSYSTAVGMFNSVVNLFFLLTASFISKKINGYGLW